MMEDNFRTVLIILSTIVILAICIHGLWTIRRNRNPYKLKAKAEPIFEETPSQRDSSGFDQDGIGQIKVIKPADKKAVKPSVPMAADESLDSTNAEIKNTQLAHHEDDLTEPLDSELNPLLDVDELSQMHNYPESNQSGIRDESAKLTNEHTNATAFLAKSAADESAEILEFHLSVDDDDIRPNSQHTQQQKQQALYADPVSQPKPNVSIQSKANHKLQADKLKRKQMEIDFEQSQNAAIDPEFLVISVHAPENQPISGAALLPCLLTLGLKYGEMNIFHRHQDNAGNGEITFSVANILNPGTFDLDHMETFVTKGVTLFMKLPNPSNPFEVFEQMLAAAQHLAKEFNGQLLDDQRSVLTKQTQQHYISKIREFERKKRLIAH
jgi:cell division protein ZipA